MFLVIASSSLLFLLCSALRLSLAPELYVFGPADVLSVLAVLALALFPAQAGLPVEFFVCFILFSFCSLCTLATTVLLVPQMSYVWLKTSAADLTARFDCQLTKSTAGPCRPKKWAFSPTTPLLDLKGCSADDVNGARRLRRPIRPISPRAPCARHTRRPAKPMRVDAPGALHLPRGRCSALQTMLSLCQLRLSGRISKCYGS